MSTSTGSTGSTGPGSRFKPRFPLPIFPRGRRGRMRVVVLLVGLVLLALFGGFYMFSMPGQSYTGPLPPLTTEEQGMADRMKRHVEVLAREIGARSTVALKGLRRAERYVEATLRELGFTPSVQPFDSDGVEVKNFEAEIRGETRPDEIVVVGAHYDSFLFVPAANDNASGVAALLEIARELRGARLACTVKFVVFVNEEPPHFARDTMGSRIYAQAAKKRGDRITGMLALETIGYYSNQKGSQHYPPPFSWFYPDTGNFIGFVGNLSSRRLVRRCIASFRGHTRFPSEGVAAPGWIKGIDWSDHRSFWHAGYPALMITDTALFRYRYYHTAEDTPEKIDYESMARVTAGVARVVEALAGPVSNPDDS